MMWGVGGDPHHVHQVLLLPPLGGPGGEHRHLATSSSHGNSPSCKNFIIIKN